MSGLNRPADSTASKIIQSLAAATLLLLNSPAAASDSAPADVRDHAAAPVAATAANLPARGVWRLLPAGTPLPQDLLQPAGRTRWDLRALAGGDRFERTLTSTGGGVDLLRDAGDLGGRLGHRERLLDAAGGDAALRWAFPERYPDTLAMDARQSLELIAETDGRRERLLVSVRTTGIGWIDLPSGPREVVLQQARLTRSPAEAPGRAASFDVTRFIDPRAGLVAIYETPLAGDATADAGTLALLEIGLEETTPLRIYFDEVDAPAFARIGFGFDVARQTVNPAIRANIADIAAGLAPGATAGDLVAQNSWDFSVVTSGDLALSYVTDQVSVTETCNFDKCGYTLPGVDLEREDRLIYGDPNNPGLVTETIFSTNITVPELRFADPNNPGTPTDYTIWLRAATQNEGRSSSGLFSTDGENRICFTSTAGNTRTPVPLYRFPHQDADGWYMQVGDPRVSSGVFQCELNVFNQNCGATGLFDELRFGGTTTGQNCPYPGQQYVEIVKEGVLTVPSGHTFNAMLLRTVNASCVYNDEGASSDCAGFLVKLDEVYTVTYLWTVPYIGTTVRLQSLQEAGAGCAGGSNPDLCFTQVAATDIKFGLFPPRSISVDAVADTSVTLSWDPGLIPDRITGFKVYWDTDSGGTGPYAFDSQSQPGQVAFNGNGAVVSGLTPGTTYHFTVTSLSDFTNPKSGVMTTFESLLYPAQIPGNGPFYPVEVMADTTGGMACNPAPSSGLTVTSLGGDGAHICWQAAAEPCVTGYQVGRGSDAVFTSCTGVETAATCLDDLSALAPGSIASFLVRPFTPTAGSWGAGSDLVERTFSCGP